MGTFARLAAIAGCVSAAVAIGLSASAFASGSSPGVAAPPDLGVRARSANPPAHTDTSFEAITPCRIVDTLVAGGALGNGAARTFFVGGSSGFPAQGGKSGGCRIPTGATAVAATVTAPTPAGHGFLRMYPANQPEPQATTLSYLQGLSGNTGTTIPIQSGVAKSLTVRNHLGPTNLIIDVSGYYIPQIEGMIASTGGVFSGSSRILAATHDGNGLYTVTIDSDVGNCTPTVTPFTDYSYGRAYGFDVNRIHVVIWRLVSGAEVNLNSYFYLNVAC